MLSGPIMMNDFLYIQILKNYRKHFSSGKSESTHPSRTVVKSIEFFYGVESVVRNNADSLLN